MQVKMKFCLNFSVSFFLFGAILFSIPYNVFSQTNGNQFPVKDCRGHSSGTCRQGECVCKEWHIALYTAEGKEWGLIIGKTQEVVQQKLKSGQQFDVAWAKFTGKSIGEDKFNHQRPGKPTCVVDCPQPSPSSTSPLEEQRWTEVENFANEIQNKMLKEIIRVTATLANLERQGVNPYKGIGLALKDYANTLRDVVEKQKELKTKLESTFNSLTDTFYEIERMQRSVADANNRLERAYGLLSNNAKNLLETGTLSRPTSGWDTQRIRDFDNSITIQIIKLTDRNIFVTQQGESNSGKTTYVLSSSDIIPESIQVKSTSAPDRYILLVMTNGRKITKQSDWINSPITDNVSKLTLYFATEEAARAAAEALKSIL
jgi:hypothetical protein